MSLKNGLFITLFQCISIQNIGLTHIGLHLRNASCGGLRKFDNGEKCNNTLKWVSRGLLKSLNDDNNISLSYIRVRCFKVRDIFLGLPIRLPLFVFIMILSYQNISINDQGSSL